MNPQYREWLAAGERAGMAYRLCVPRTALRGAGGVRLGMHAGSSVDFRDYRDYEPGDDLRHIDWNIYARSDRLVVKLFREEVSPHLDVVIDGSRSMALAPGAKAEAALRLAAALATAAGNARCSHGGWITTGGCERIAGGTDRPTLWDGVEFAGAISPGDALANAPPAWRRHGLRVLISDLLWPGEPLATLRPLADGAAALAVVQVLGRADAEPDVHGDCRLIDSETEQERELFVDATALAQYRERLSRHESNWQRACRQAGASLVTLIAEDLIGSGRFSALEEAEILGAA